MWTHLPLPGDDIFQDALFSLRVTSFTMVHQFCPGLKFDPAVEAQSLLKEAREVLMVIIVNPIGMTFEVVGLRKGHFAKETPRLPRMMTTNEAS